MNLRDQIIKDTQRVFLNPLEFAELHMLDDGQNGVRRLLMIVETYTLDGKPMNYADGITAANIVVHIDRNVLGYDPDPQTEMIIDGVHYTLDGVANEFGMLKLALSANVSST
ncbi:hypothetical protein D1872_54680 [compost metagenome]